MSQLLGIYAGAGFAHHVGDGIARNEVHHQKDDERDTEQRGDQEQQATQEIFAHSMPILGQENSLLSQSPCRSARMPHRWSVSTPQRPRGASVLSGSGS